MKVFEGRLTSAKSAFREFYLIQGSIVVGGGKGCHLRVAGVTRWFSSGNRLSFSDHHFITHVSTQLDLDPAAQCPGFKRYKANWKKIARLENHLH